MVATAASHPDKQAIPSLDGIRAIAVSIVFLAHSGLQNLVPGGLGVTVFFVLSGYLITTLMRTEHAATGAIRFGAFYLRRVLRLMPPLLIVVLVAELLSAAGLLEGSFSARGLCSALFYFGNYYEIGHWDHGVVGFPAGIGVVWSLAVEEHYYLLYPPLVSLLLLRMRGNGMRALILALLCGVVLARRIWLVRMGYDENYLTMATDTRVDAILVGCLMAWWRNPWIDPVPSPAGRRDQALAAACILVLLATLLIRNEWFRLTWRYTLQSLAIAPLIYLAVARADRLPYRWLNTRPVVYLGTISYSVYLSHHIIMFTVGRHWPQLGWLPATLLCAALTLVAAELMRRTVEEPCARLRKRLHRRAPDRTGAGSEDAAKGAEPAGRNAPAGEAYRRGSVPLN